MASFVLIPGAGTDPRVYARTIAALESRGHDAIAPALPLDDDAARPTDHAAAVVEGAAGLDSPVVVAQSLGAFAGPIAASELQASALVLLAPMIPRPGETAGEWWENTGHQEAIADLIERRGPMSSWGQEALEEVFLHDVNPAIAAESAELSGAPGPGMFGEPWPLEAWPDMPTWVLAPRSDRLFPLEFQRRVARERMGIEVDEMEGGHLPMLSRPEELADRLIELVSTP